MPVILVSGTCWSVGSLRQERWRNSGMRVGLAMLGKSLWSLWNTFSSHLPYHIGNHIPAFLNGLVINVWLIRNCHFHINASLFASSMACNRKHSTCKETLFRDFYWSLYCQVGCEVWLMWRKAYRLPKVNAQNLPFAFRKYTTVRIKISMSHICQPTM